MFSKPTPGFTLIEMIIAIVVISVGLAGILLALGTNVGASADPMIRKQMLVIAEEMLEEILLMPYATGPFVPVVSSQQCGISVLPSRAAYDDISDFNGFRTSGICDISGAAVIGLERYNVSVAVAQVALGSASSGGEIPASDAKQITVTVTHGTDRIDLTGFRTRYVP